MRAVIFYLLIIFPLFSQSVDLLKKCNARGESCQARKWYAVEGFRLEYTKIKEIPQDWQLFKDFPSTLEKNFSTENKTFQYYTFTTSFFLSESYFKDLPEQAITFGYIGEVFDIYLNGHLIVSEGSVENGRVVLHRSVANPIFPIHAGILHVGKNRLVVKIGGDPRANTMGFYYKKNYRIAAYRRLQYQNRDRTGLVLNFLYLFVGFYHLFLYVRRRKEVYNLFFALYCLVVFIYFSTRSNIRIEHTLDTLLLMRLEYITVYLLIPFFLLFINTLFIKQVTRITKYYTIFCISLGIYTAFGPTYIIQYVLRFWQLTAVFMVFYVLFLFIQAIQKKNPDAKRLFLGLSIFLVATIIDIIGSSILKQNLLISRYGFFAFIIGIAVILANRFLSLYQTVEELNENLEQKVADRTMELQSSFQEIRGLKEKQDGDYFLTTLIIKPLMSNATHSENVEVEFLLTQKKKFEFRKKQHEIGGDICIADTIHLKGREYTVFVNGDAMGKSIQGAGGAIVLGVVFKSIISRTRLLPGSDDLFPEFWLKHSFIELQKVFESFDGSMLISVVMGLIDNENGFMYYVNAEHPWSALYRDGKSSFIENENSGHLYKIGITGIFGGFMIKTFHMLDGDCIFLGSDGRDDINLAGSADERVINEDETLFLRNIEKAGGDTEKLFKIIQGIGEMTDDLSLMRLCFHDKQHIEVTEEQRQIWQRAEIDRQNGELKLARQEYHRLEKINPRYIGLLAQLAEVYFQQDNFTRAEKYFKKHLCQQPWDVKRQLLLAKSLKMQKKYSEAIEWSQRLKLREPKNEAILELLVELYLETGKEKKAKKMIDKLFKIQPENTVAKKYQKTISQQK